MPRKTKPPGKEKWSWEEINQGRKFTEAERADRFCERRRNKAKPELVERIKEWGIESSLAPEEIADIWMRTMKIKVTMVLGKPPEGDGKSGKEKRRTRKALTTVHDLRDRVQLYWVGSKRNRLSFPIDDHSDGWIAYENEKKAEAARQQLLSQLSPLLEFELGRAFEILRAFHEHASGTGADD